MAVFVSPGSAGRTDVGVLGTGSSLPERRVSSGEVADVVSVERSWITERIGVLERRFSTQDETSLDFAIGADGDRLFLADLLEGFDPATSDANEFVSLSEQAGDTVVGVNADGQGADSVALVTLAGVTGAALDTLITDGNVVVTPPTS